MNIIPIMTSRGCPFNCNFCTVTKIFGRQYRKQSADRVIKEIKNALNFFNLPYIFFYDDNFSANKKETSILLDKIIENKLDIVWTAQVRADICKDKDLLNKMFKAGAERFYIGFESIDDKVLEYYHKSQTKQNIIDSINIIHKYGISIHGMFIFGEKHDNIENIKNTMEFAINYDIDTVQFMILTPFPGTEVYNQFVAENRLLHKNWKYYDGMHAVFKPENISAYDLQKYSLKAYKGFYSFNRTILDFIQFWFNISFDAFVWNFKKIYRYDLNNLFLKMGAKLIIKHFIKQNLRYSEYLKNQTNQINQK